MICISNRKKDPANQSLCLLPARIRAIPFHAHSLEWLATYGQYKNRVEVRNTLYSQLPLQLYILLFTI